MKLPYEVDSFRHIMVAALHLHHLPGPALRIQAAGAGCPLNCG